MENLEVRVRERALGNISEPTRIHADPDDIPALMRHLEIIARDWGGHAPDNGWLTDYEFLVASLERPWLEFTLAATQLSCNALWTNYIGCGLPSATAD